MKQFLIAVLVIVGFCLWFKDWAASGKMDNFIAQHQRASWTPDVLFLISEAHYLAQDPQPAIFYYRWILKDYPKDDRIPKIRWQLGKCYEANSQKDLAVEQYIVLKDSFTRTEYGALAQGRFQQMRF